MKMTLYTKDDKIRAARYVRYIRRAWCPSAVYPSNISYLQSCVDDIDDTPEALEVTIAGASGDCTGPLIYGRSGDFLCAEYSGSTLVNPDCPPTGYTVDDSEIVDPGALCVTVPATTFTTPYYIKENWEADIGGSIEGAQRIWLSTDAACPAGTPSGSYCGFSWTRTRFDCDNTSKSTTAGDYEYSIGSKSVSIGGGFTLSFVCGSGVVSVSVSTAYFLITPTAQIYVKFYGTGNDVSLDGDCAPSGECTIPVYCDKRNVDSYCSGDAGVCADFGCAAVTPMSAAEYIGDLVVTFGRCA